LLVEIEKEYQKILIKGSQVFLNIPENQVKSLVSKIERGEGEIISIIPNRESLEELFMSEVK